MLLETLNSERFADTAPAAVHATLLDEGQGSSCAGLDLLLGPLQAILQPFVPGRTRRLRHAVVDMPQGQLLGRSSEG